RDVGRCVLGVGVEHEAEVARGRRQPGAHGGALPPVAVVGTDHQRRARAGRLEDGPRPVGGGVVDGDDLVGQGKLDVVEVLQDLRHEALFVEYGDDDGQAPHGGRGYAPRYAGRTWLTPSAPPPLSVAEYRR